MQYVLFGVVALLLLLLAMHGFTVANAHVLARRLRVSAGVVALAGAGVLLVRGLVGYAMSLAALGTWLLWGGGGLPWASTGGAQKSAGQTSRVTTEHLEMELDHDTGEIRGHVLKGFFAGRTLESLAPVEMAHLWQDCRFADPQSAQILEAYLDRVHPTWREDMARADGTSDTGPNGAMSRAQALDILGLKEGASDDEIRRAHRELMMRMHPDRGGSTFLAAKINEAKDVLLGK
ncbi:MAG: DnaJ domain-containing protein [Hyphomicrobiaceae bacterium]|nr:MAG: DnaJ domain-containing protein [Hyphomicrobiaceae bacterium]